MPGVRGLPVYLGQPLSSGLGAGTADRLGERPAQRHQSSTEVISFILTVRSSAFGIQSMLMFQRGTTPRSVRRGGIARLGRSPGDNPDPATGT